MENYEKLEEGTLLCESCDVTLSSHEMQVAAGYSVGLLCSKCLNEYLDRW